MLIQATCFHQQAEPVILSTGETVACVCIGCLEPLPADHISKQIERALREHYDPTYNPFMEDLMDSLLKPLQDPDSRASIVPIRIRGVDGYEDCL